MLSHVIGTRGSGQRVPERDLVIEHRHLYRSIEAGFAHLAHKIGEERLFVGPPQAQITQANFAWPQLVPVTDLAGATAAIEAIVEQGEGPRGDWRDAHFGRLKRVLDEYLGMRAADPTFEPARPVLAARVPARRRRGGRFAHRRAADRQGRRPVQRRL